ncbi:MAG: protocatechuate 3,4-dioxygenase, partial [Acidimicrobiales bacterium]|nr:protocatechuate 3,4-dioxygenase [Acidimicrobiales bacterium]
MAQLVAALATSHTPLLVTDADLWPMMAERDRTNPMLYDNRGAHRTYDELAAEAGDRHAAVLTAERFGEHHRSLHAALDRLAADLAAAAPDLVVIVGDDQHELFDDTNQPAIAIGWGDTLHTGRSASPPSPLNDQIRVGYAMDRAHPFPGDPAAATALIGSLLRRGFDVASVASPASADGCEPDGGGYGHAYGFVIRRLFGGRAIPVVPVLLNTFYPPNQPSAARCHDLGRALADAIAELPGTARVAVIASGGLSHFVVDEDLDAIVVDALRRGDGAPLRELPAHLLEAGSSEIRNWITVAG